MNPPFPLQSVGGPQLRPKGEGVVPRRIRVGSAIAAIAAGVAVVGGWLADIAFLKSVFPNLATMKFNTAVGFVLCGCSLLLIERESGGKRRWSAWVSSLVVLLGAITLLAYAGGFELFLDELIVADRATDPARAPPGRMSVATAACFVLLGAAIARIDVASPGGMRSSQWMALLVVAAGLTGFLGHLFGVSALQEFEPFASMALHTAILFVALGCGVLTARPDAGWLRELTRDGVGGYGARRGLLLVLTLPTLTAWVFVRLANRGVYPVEIAMVLTLVVCVAFFSWALWRAARSLNHLEEDLDAGGRVVEASNVSRDMSEIHRLNEELRRSLRETGEFKRALDEHAIVAATDPSGKITYVNDTFCAISQYSREELIGQDHRMINSGYHPKAFFHDLWSTIGRGEVWRGEIRNRAKDGSIYWVETTIVPFLNEDGKPRQYLALRTDITEIKRIQDDLARSNRDLEQFAYVASHDLQEPLRAVAGCLQLLSQRYRGKLDDQADELIGHAVDGANRMGSLIEGLLAFSRAGRTERDLRTVDFGEALRSALSNLETTIEENHADVTFDPLPSLRGDPAQVTLLFQNLVGNAIKFRREEPPRVHVSAKPDSGYWTFTVEDNGIGIEPRYFERIFTIFQRLHTRREYPGTGLGLALCQRLVEHNGGRMWVESTPGKGSRFFFRWPDPA